MPSFARVPVRTDWKQIRGSIDLVGVVARFLGPAPGRNGDRRRQWWHCPFHEDRNPSFCVEPGKPWWRCFGCGEHGDAANLVMRMEGVSFPEAVSRLVGGPAPSWKTGSRPKPTSQAVSKPTAPTAPNVMTPEAAAALVAEAAARLWAPEGADALAYLTGPDRCLTPETIRAARLGWTPKADGIPWKPSGVVIPWFNRGRLALVKVRPLDGWRNRFPVGKRPPKYIEAFRDPALVALYPGPEAVRPGHPLIVVEGEFDALCLAQELGGTAAVVTLGSASAPLTPVILGIR